MKNIYLDEIFASLVGIRTTKIQLLQLIQFGCLLKTINVVIGDPVRSSMKLGPFCFYHRLYLRSLFLSSLDCATMVLPY